LSAEFRFARASSWTFFIKVWSGLQQTSQRSRSSSGISCLPPVAQTHQGTAQSGYSTDKKGKLHALTKLALPTGKSVVVVGLSQGEFLAPSMVGYFDRRLGIKSPWFTV
jgi:hypothetical protein